MDPFPSTIQRWWWKCWYWKIEERNGREYLSMPLSFPSTQALFVLTMVCISFLFLPEGSISKQMQECISIGLGFDFNDYYIIFATPHLAMLMTTLYITKIDENKKSNWRPMESQLHSHSQWNAWMDGAMDKHTSLVQSMLLLLLWQTVSRAMIDVFP